MRSSSAFRSFLVNFHVDWCGDWSLVLLEVEQAGLDIAEGVEVVGRNDFTLDDGKVNLHLIEPRRVGVQGGATQGGPAFFEPGRCRPVRGGRSRCRPPRVLMT